MHFNYEMCREMCHCTHPHDPHATEATTTVETGTILPPPFLALQNSTEAPDAEERQLFRSLSFLAFIAVSLILCCIGMYLIRMLCLREMRRDRRVAPASLPEDPPPTMNESDSSTLAGGSQEEETKCPPEKIVYICCNEVQEDLCQCECYYDQMEGTADNSHQRGYSSTHFLDFRDPCFPYNSQTKLANQADFDARFKEYKAKRDAEDAIKEPIAPAPPELEDRVHPNCLYDELPEPKFRKGWKANERWWRTPTDDCRKRIVKKYIWTTTYRKVNKDGAALHFIVLTMKLIGTEERKSRSTSAKTKREIPESSKERNANPIPNLAELAEKTLIPIASPTFEKWDRPQVRLMAGRCDTMYNNNRPNLCYDTYFKEHRLCRGAFAQEHDYHATPTRENMDLVKKEKLRLVNERPIPGYAGYDCIVPPPICKIKKNMNRFDPYEIMSFF